MDTQVLRATFPVPSIRSIDRIAPFSIPEPEAVDNVLADGSKLLFLDLEASSLRPGSWPIEIGCAWIEAGRVRASASVIAPRPHWSMEGWSDASAEVHGLSIEDVRAGRPADDLADLTDGLADFTVLSDNPLHDQAWLDSLRDGRPRVRVQSLRLAVGTVLKGQEADMFSLLILRGISEHRAGPDAERLAHAWLSVTELRKAA